MNLNLAHKIGIVTGASRGIGRAIGETLSAEGMSLTLAARSRESLEQVASSLATPSLVHAADLSELSAPQALIDATLKRFGKIDLLVNNAGATIRGDFLALAEKDWQDGFGLKFFGAMRCCRAAWNPLRATRGAIVNIVGVGGRTGAAEFAIGGAVNAALLNLTKVLADRGVTDGIRVNAINPGSIATARLTGRIEKFAAEHALDLKSAAAELARSMAIARFGEPAEIARAVAFLASDAAAYFQGSIVDIDGGLTRTL